MAPDVEHSWLEANQRYLSTAIAAVRSDLVRHAARSVDGHPGDEPPSPDALRHECHLIAQRLPQAPALDAVSRAFNLTPFERDVLVLCAGMELDSAFGGICGRAHGDAQRAYPTFGLALAALPDAHWSALLPDGPLRYWHLIEFGSGGSPSAPLTSRPLRIDERVLHYLAGLAHADERLASLVSPVRVEYAVVPTHRAIAEHVVTAWKRSVERVAPPVIMLYGADLASARSIAAAACQACGWNAYIINERLIPSSATDLHLLTRLLEREVRLDSAAILIECQGLSSDTNRDGALRDLIDRTNGPLIVMTRERQQLGRRPTASFEVVKPTSHEQRVIWQSVLLGDADEVTANIDQLTAQFSLNVPEIESAAEEARAEAGPVSGRSLWKACRHQSRGRLDDLAQRISSMARLDDLVLPDSQKEVLRDIVTHVKNRATVHDAWGFAGQSNRGLGISALFAGSSGTGKTMSAEVLAGALELDLYRIDLSSVVSKYIGETEKNLRRIFDAADGGGVILLFDEADALFGKRSEVKDSHDRYANIEVSYLLQRMESYRGLAILTTNMRSALDVAFMRRIRFIVQFPFPDAAQRAQIWRKVFPRDTPTLGLDVERLAQLSVAGGSIRNVALNAAFLAADTNEPVGMSHVLRAARSEYAKLEKALTDTEVAGWV
jgi:AAA+ superfamily predicted ATPase